MMLLRLNILFFLVFNFGCTSFYDEERKDIQSYLAYLNHKNIGFSDFENYKDCYNDFTKILDTTGFVKIKNDVNRLPNLSIVNFRFPIDLELCYIDKRGIAFRYLENTGIYFDRSKKEFYSFMKGHRLDSFSMVSIRAILILNKNLLPKFSIKKDNNERGNIFSYYEYYNYRNDSLDYFLKQTNKFSVSEKNGIDSIFMKLKNLELSKAKFDHHGHLPFFCAVPYWIDNYYCQPFLFESVEGW